MSTMRWGKVMTNSTNIAGYTAEDVVKKYVEIRDFVAAETKAFKERMKVYNDGLETLEAMAASMMATTKQTKLSTEYGTAYREPQLSVTCSDKDLFHEWVRENGSWHFLTAHVSKEAVEQYIEENDGQSPPHLKVDRYNAVRFRRR